MNDPFTVSELGRGEDLLDESHGVGNTHSPLDQILQRGAVDVFHGDEVGIAEGASIEHSNHVGVLQTRSRLCFALEPLDELGILSKAIVEDLDCNLAVQLRVGSQPDIGHTTSADLSDQLVALIHNGSLACASH